MIVVGSSESGLWTKKLILISDLRISGQTLISRGDHRSVASHIHVKCCVNNQYCSNARRIIISISIVIMSRPLSQTRNIIIILVDIIQTKLWSLWYLNTKQSQLYRVQTSFEYCCCNLTRNNLLNPVNTEQQSKLLTFADHKSISCLRFLLKLSF